MLCCPFLNTEDKNRNLCRRKCCFGWSLCCWIIFGAMSLYGIVLVRYSTLKGPCPYFKTPSRYTFSHRGYIDQWQENTIGSLLDTLANNSVPEFDVILTKDDIPVLFHDVGMKRMTGVNVNIHDVTWAQLQQMNISRVIDGYTFPQTARIPSFEQAIAAMCAVDPAASMVIDTKFLSRVSPNPRDGVLNDAIVKALKSSACTGGTIFVQSHPFFIKDLVDKTKALNKFTVFGGVVLVPQASLGLGYALLQSRLWVAQGNADYVSIQYFVYKKWKTQIDALQRDGWCTGIYGDKNVTRFLDGEGANNIFKDLPGKFVYKGDGPKGEFTQAESDSNVSIYNLMVLAFTIAFVGWACLSCFCCHSCYVCQRDGSTICESCGNCSEPRQLNHHSQELEMV